ncbi:MAG TPA: cyclic nucleotide-binding domain-containing protein, partial [Leptospiraceae bacterium]|nr:cyclic nucleotide-binding domain-containing protein [Leptospiraceae bacterium]
MPIARNYNGGSIVYFAGDKGDEVYVLQSGRVLLISTALDTGEEIREDVQIGEFFGVK